jgi:predicted O-linked N-acetylglucosamine transferase (SPINDLY family)
MIPAADLLALADRFQRFGALRQAERLYREAAEHRPEEADRWARLGRVRREMGRHEEAIESLREAVRLDPSDPGHHTDLGAVLMEQGRLDEAVARLGEALRLRPDDPVPHRILGIVRMRQGDFEAAASGFRRALELDPVDPASARLLGDALVALGDRGEAVDWYGRAVRLEPESLGAWLNLGRALVALGRIHEGLDGYDRAIRSRPDDPGPIAELAGLLMQRDELDAAVDRYEQLLRLLPDCAGAYCNLGLALMGLGRLEEARLSFEQALCLQPDLAEVHNNLGLAYLNQGRLDEALPCFERAIRLRPDLADAHNNLGLALAALERPGDARESYERAARIDPHHVGALTNLGNAYQDLGRAAEAVALFRKALAAEPAAARVHSNLILAMQYQAGADPQEILAKAREFGQRHAVATAEDPGPGRLRDRSGRHGRLRIGYVSANLREHALCLVLEPILAAHDHDRFEIVCYTDVRHPDAVTERLRGHADLWRSLVGLSDDQAADAIRRDEIDLLVDLDGHTGGNRLLAFARRPAPVQVSYLGFLGSTGLATMDAYITDAHADPPGLSESHYQERLIRLPYCALCYSPGPGPEARPEPPARGSGRMTFGCLNNPAKVNDAVLDVWSRVLAEVPGSRFLLPSGAGEAWQERVRQFVSRRGIAPDRLVFAGRAATRFDYLELYHAVDIALDPFPYNGVTTTFDALWMGVPVISLEGRMNVSRQGVRFLRNIGLDELLAGTTEGYVRIAADLACDPGRLAGLRSGLRERMSRSPLMDAQRLTRDLESALQTVHERRLALGDRLTPPDRSG